MTEEDAEKDLAEDESKEEKIELTPGQKRRIIELSRRAEEAYNKQNYAWAAELYWEIYQLNRAGNVEYLKKMILSGLGAKNLAGNPIIYGIKQVFSHISVYLTAIKTKDSEENKYAYFEAYENIIKFLPDSSFAVPKLSAAYEKADLKENSALLLEAFLKKSSKPDLNLLRKMGDLFLETENYEKARAAFKKILSIKPFDQAAEKKLKDVLAMTSIDESKLKGSSFKDSIRDKDAAQKAQLELKVNKSAEELDYLIKEKKKDIERNPSNLSLFHDLLSYLRDAGRKKEVLEVLDKIVSFNPGDIAVLKEKLIAEVDYIEEKHASDSEDERNKIINERKKEVYTSLTEQYTQSVDLKFELAKVCFDLNDYDTALKLFQIASTVRDYAVASANYKGLIFHEKSMHDLASEEFQKGIALETKMSQFKKEMIYNLGLSFEASGQVDKAIEQYKEIFKIDISFKDVSKRIESFYSK